MKQIEIIVKNKYARLFSIIKKNFKKIILTAEYFISFLSFNGHGFETPSPSSI